MPSKARNLRFHGERFMKRLPRPEAGNDALQDKMGTCSKFLNLARVSVIGQSAKALAILLLCLLLLQCGYRLRGTGSFLPEHIKKINVPLFKNFTTRFELDLKLTQAVINELVARGKVDVTSDAQNADAVLVGEIMTCSVNPIAFTGDARADSYAITIAARIVLKDNKNQREIFSNPYISYQEEYNVPQGSDFESLESDALNKVAESFARALVITILEGF